MKYFVMFIEKMSVGFYTIAIGKPGLEDIGVYLDGGGEDQHTEEETLAVFRSALGKYKRVINRCIMEGNIFTRTEYGEESITFYVHGMEVQTVRKDSVMYERAEYNNHRTWDAVGKLLQIPVKRDIAWSRKGGGRPLSRGREEGSK